MFLRFPLPWRSFVVETILAPAQAQESIARAGARRRLWEFVAASTGFRFVLRTRRRKSWIVVVGAIEPRPFGSRVGVRIRASLPEIVVLGVSALLLPGAILGATLVRGQGLATLNRYLVFAMLLGPCNWLVLSLVHTHYARKIEQWLRSALPEVVTVDGSSPVKE